MADVIDRPARERLTRWLSHGEDAIYLATGGLLGVTAVVILLSTAGVFIDAIRMGALIPRSVQILDALLLVLMIVEILHTIRVSIIQHSLQAEPFLIVALIAGVRRILILTVEAARFLSDKPDQFHRVLLEMGVLTVYFVVIVGSIVLIRRVAPPGAGGATSG